MALIALVLTWAFSLASAVPSALPGPPGPWRWPLSPDPQVLRGFSPPLSPWGPGHRGVDLVATPGQAVYAAAAGQVSFAGYVAGHGVVVLTHGVLRTTYLPVIPSVRTGRHLPVSARLGTVQDLPGHCGPLHCLHWGLRHDLRYLDPLSLLRPGVRLLPYWSSQRRLQGVALHRAGSGRLR
ncbi:Peptidase family M23 [Thermomonospora echinospora]|uniref:Peptidase family M23 n=1 Tax=Thermomonospora echinospora TaxID=1992 RepID=A0A1H6DQX5_9ACTN|nr:M23 family metallopeptidase [Thermomonospora echinospora]SEG86995.1 Peptidase family M23 [Thermomonospora echinospora]